MTRVALVTGAACGLGHACARRLAADGHDLALVDLDERALSRAAEELRDSGTTVSTHVADLREAAACRQVTTDARAHHGRIDVLVNAAGVYPRRPVLNIAEDDWQLVLQVNLLGTYYMMTAAIAAMREQGSGHIVNVSSIDGFKAHPDNAHYAASKAGVISLTRSLALEVAPLGILINSVAPGPMATEAAKATDWYAPMVAQLPTRHPIEPDEVAANVAHLASPHNRSITGENVVISGGAVIV